MAVWIVRNPEGKQITKIEAGLFVSGNLAAVFKTGNDEVALVWMAPGMSVVKEQNDK